MLSFIDMNKHIQHLGVVYSLIIPFHLIKKNSAIMCGVIIFGLFYLRRPKAATVAL